MTLVEQVSWWLTGGDTPYMTLYHCMSHDTLWIAITVILDVTVAVGYILIAMHWWRNSRLLPPTPAKRALGNIRNIFVFCGLCGYVFIPVKMFWPAWRLYDLFMVVLAYFTWRYAIGARELKVVYNELGRSNRLAADLEESRRQTREKGFFLNAISHDLRTPLNGLILQASVAEMSADDNDREALRQAVTHMKASARTAANMLDSFLEYARLTAGPDSQPVSFDLADGVRRVVEPFRSRASQQGLTLHLHLPSAVNVELDRTKLERILSNLLDNALKFTTHGEIRVEAETNASGVEIHVLDSGSGIAPEHRDKLFDEFFQVGNKARDPSQGFGLGLAIANRLAQQLGGDLAVESAPGAGSRFTLVLPGVVRGKQSSARESQSSTVTA